VNAPRAGRVWVAIQVGDARSVQPCERMDAQGIETRSVVPIQEGMHLTVAVRFSSGSATNFEIPMRVTKVEGRVDAGGSLRVRLDFCNADPGVVREIAVLADALGVFRGEVPAYTPPVARSNGPMRATAQGESAAWVLRFPSADQRRAVAAQVVAGSLFVETVRPPPVNTRLLLRIDDVASRPLYLEARVAYTADGHEGPAGVGLAIERLPAVVADALRR
jgi:hypothetical protein